jgi:small GTP-binding protein
MPIPHHEMRRIIKRRIQGLTPAERIPILESLLEELPGYYQGPYGELRKWVHALIAEAETRRRVTHHAGFAVARDGDAQVVLAGVPNAGKSSLLRALTGRPVAVGDYAFTTLRPAAGMVAVNGAAVQLVDLPGLLAGAHDGRGQGRAVLGAMRAADAIVLVVALTTEGVEDAHTVRAELQSAGLSQPLGLVATKGDLPEAEPVWRALRADAGIPLTAACSVHDGTGLNAVRTLLWTLTGLLRVYVKRPGRRSSGDLLVVKTGTTVAALAARVAPGGRPAAWRQARVTGPSATFARQPVGPEHLVQDGDVVELV